MKRILILNYEFPPLGGGGGVAAYKLAKGFIRNGYNVDYVTSWYKRLKKYEVIDGIKIHRIKIIGRKELFTANMISLLSFPFLAYKKCVELCKKNNYEFINTHFAIPTGPLGIVIARKFKIKNILSIHGGDIYDPTRKKSPHNKWHLKKIVQWVLNNSDVVVAQSLNTKDNAIKYFNPNKDIRVIPLPYEPFQFKRASRYELGLSLDKKYIIGVGRLIERKGFDFFIKTLARLPENFYGIILGEGPERKNLETLAYKLNIENKLIMPGFVSEEKKFQYLSNSDIFVLTSLYEGFGIVLQEAMQVGLPIIAVNNGGQVDFIKEGKNGYLIKFNDINNLIERVNRIVNDKKNKVEFSNFNREEIKKFKTKNICEKYIKTLQ